MTVEDILKRYWRPEGEGGAGNERALIGALEDHCRSTRRQNLMIMALVVILLLVAIAALVHDLLIGEEKLLAVIGGAGLSIPALMTLLIARMADLSKTELMLRIARHSDAPTIRGLIDKALTK